MNKCHLSMAMLLLPGSSFPVFATEIDPVVVTATRTARTADDTLAPVTIVTRDDIKRQQAQSIRDVLRGMPGIGIANSGGAGKNTSVYLRGTESDHVLVLIDGVKVGSATSGTTSFQHIPIEQIERIEIARGPRSSLYGSEAVGGVIQIFTRKGGGRTKPFFSIGYGAHHTYDITAGISGGGERGWYNLSISGVDTKGFDAKATEEPDDDGYRDLSGFLRAGYRFHNGIDVDIHAMRARNDTEFDGSFQNESESVQQVLGGTLRYSPMDPWQLTLSAGQSRDDLDSFKDGVFKDRFDTTRHTFLLQNDFSVTDKHLLTLGIDYQDDRIQSTKAFRLTSRDNRGVFAQYQGALFAHDLQFSLRRDENQQFGARDTGSAAWGYAFGEGLRISAGYGGAFKAPTFNELYYPNYGNPDLGPEESRSFEIGLDGKVPWGRWNLDAYETRIDDLIAYDASTTAAANIQKTRIRGLESTFATRMQDWDIEANLTLLDPENRSSDNPGNVLPRRARQSLRFDADRQFGKYAIGATLVAENERYDDLANTEKVSGYATLDLRAEYELTRDWRLQARVENVFDKDYETVASYHQPGRGLFLTLRYQP
uniref:Vitamin B12 transporter n=1 Tax=Candidatus Kentrum sp. SD TaxID=2126332 RepID=A0A451BMI1_9GAMM|nr:MAG: vitamin B12 transporter [Candidatus Kentron sp. SD]